MDIIKKIELKYQGFTKGLKQVGDNYMLDPIIFATHPAKVIGEKIGVSENMIIRFYSELGFSGFKEFQKAIQLSLLNVGNSQIHGQQMPSGLLNSMYSDIEHIKKNISLIDEKKINEVIDIIVNAERRLIVGHYHSFIFAHWLYINMRHYIDDTMLYRVEDDIDMINSLPKGSILVVFSFFRYSKISINLAKEAKEKGLKVIAITDSPFSPITEISDVYIPLSFTKNKGTLHKAPITISFINLLLFEILNKCNVDTGLSEDSQKFYINYNENSKGV